MKVAQTMFRIGEYALEGPRDLRRLAAMLDVQTMFRKEEFAIVMVLVDMRVAQIKLRVEEFVHYIGPNDVPY